MNYALKCGEALIVFSVLSVYSVVSSTSASCVPVVACKRLRICRPAGGSGMYLTLSFKLKAFSSTKRSLVFFRDIRGYLEVYRNLTMPHFMKKLIHEDAGFVIRWLEPLVQ